MKEIIWKEESLGAEFEYKDIRDELKEESEKVLDWKLETPNWWVDNE